MASQIQVNNPAKAYMVKVLAVTKIAWPYKIKFLIGDGLGATKLNASRCFIIGE